MPLNALYTCVQDAKRLSPDAFLDRWGDPVLVIEPYVELEQERFDTVLTQEEDSSGGVARVARLVKGASSNSFSQMITIDPPTAAQPLHRDDGKFVMDFRGILDTQVGCIWALEDFTEEIGP